MSNTREVLLHRARELFNAHGVEEVGVRDLARALDLSPGNVSYWFPRKEDLVVALLAELRDQRSRTLVSIAGAETLADFLGAYRETFADQYEHRGLVRAMVHLVEAFPSVAADYEQTDRRRRQELRAALVRLRERGELRCDTDDADLARIVGVCSITARFWLGEYRLSYQTLPPERVIAHYLALIAEAVCAHASPDACRAARPFLDGVLLTEAVGAATTPGEP